VSARLDSLLDTQRLAQCHASDDVQADERLNATLRAIRRAPVRSVADLLAMVIAVTQRVEDIDRSTNEFGDLRDALDKLADAEHALENVQPFDSATAQKWADVPHRRTV
jgi:hypothetical protein